MASTMRFDTWENPTATKSVTMDQIAGGSGLVPILPTSVSVASGTSSVSAIGSITFSGCTSFTLDNIFDTTTYKKYKIIATYTGSADTEINFRFKAGSTTCTTSYFGGGLYANFVGTLAAGAAKNNASSSYFGYAATNTRGTSWVYEFNFQASAPNYSYNGGGSGVATFYAGQMATEAVGFTSPTGFTVIPVNGAISGNIQVYGYRQDLIMEDITPADSVVPVYFVPLTEEELAEREQWAIEAAEREAAELAKVAAKEAALKKLAKLGLTEEEITALIGA